VPRLAIDVPQSAVNTSTTTANVVPNLVGGVLNPVGKWLQQWDRNLQYENSRVKRWL
jgi:hypothetical protein